MKKIIISLLMLFILAVSCEEADFLKEMPKDAIFADNLYVNYDGFQMALNALKGFVAEERTGVLQVNVEVGGFFKMGTDNVTTNTGWSVARTPSWYEVGFNSNWSDANNLFAWLFRTINSANMLIVKAENPDINWQGLTSQQSEERKLETIAHAKLIWAWAYRHLTYLWGNVPLSQEIITGANYRNDWERNSVQEIWNEMEQYLLFAEEYLPQQSNDPTVITKAVPRHYLAEFYLTMNRPEDAEKKLLLVANDPQYRLITERYGVRKNEPGVPFMDQFYDGNSLRSQGNTEAIWVFIGEQDVTGSPGFSMRRGWLTRYDVAGIPLSAEYGGRGLAMHALTTYAFDVYDDPNDDRFSEYAIRKSWEKMDGTVVMADMSKTGEKQNNFTRAHTRKFDWAPDDPSLVAQSLQYNDQIYIRLGETYLLLAEAQMKIGKTVEAAEWINKLRRRANATEITAGDLTMDFILDERSRELLAEEHRRHTLVRTGTWFERTKKYNLLAAPNVKEHFVKWPIPQPVIDANVDRLMEQNPGY